MTYNNKDLFAPDSTSNDRAEHTFNTKGSAGVNNVELARILAAIKNAGKRLGWLELEEFAEIIAQYQASVEGLYHNDWVKIATIEELDRRMSMRRSNSQQQQPSGGFQPPER